MRLSNVHFTWRTARSWLFLALALCSVQIAAAQCIRTSGTGTAHDAYTYPSHAPACNGWATFLTNSYAAGGNPSWFETYVSSSDTVCTLQLTKPPAAPMSPANTALTGTPCTNYPPPAAPGACPSASSKLYDGLPRNSGALASPSMGAKYYCAQGCEVVTEYDFCGQLDGDWFCTGTDRATANTCTMGSGDGSTQSTPQAVTATAPTPGEAGKSEKKCGGTITMGSVTTSVWTDCQETVEQSTESNTRTSVVGTDTIGIQDTVKTTTTCQNGTCTTVVDTTSTVVTSGGGFNTGTVVTSTVGSGGHGNGTGSGQGGDGQGCPDDGDRLACMRAGQPGDESPARTSLTFSYGADAMSGISSGTSCPAPLVREVMDGTSLTIIDYTETCDILANIVKPIVLLLAAFIAFVIVLPGGRVD